MLSAENYIKASIALDLFFLRIMKEHCYFLEISFTPRDSSLAQTADYYKAAFDGLLKRAASLANGALDEDTLRSGQFYTQYTLDAENKTQFFTGAPIDTSVTATELAIQPGSSVSADADKGVSDLNADALASTLALAGFKSSVLNNVLSCRIFTTNYPLVIDHMLREARLYANSLTRLQNGENLILTDFIGHEVFWDVNLKEHSEFTRGMLDPTEKQLIQSADGNADMMGALAAKTAQATREPASLPETTARNLEAALKVSEFDSSGTSGLLQCKIRSVIPPLLSDHDNREANHYIYLLKHTV